MLMHFVLNHAESVVICTLKLCYILLLRPIFPISLLAWPHLGLGWFGDDRPETGGGDVLHTDSGRAFARGGGNDHHRDLAEGLRERNASPPGGTDGDLPNFQGR